MKCTEDAKMLSSLIKSNYALLLPILNRILPKIIEIDLKRKGYMIVTKMPKIDESGVGSFERPRIESEWVEERLRGLKELKVRDVDLLKSWRDVLSKKKEFRATMAVAKEGKIYLVWHRASPHLSQAFPMVVEGMPWIITKRAMLRKGRVVTTHGTFLYWLGPEECDELSAFTNELEFTLSRFFPDVVVEVNWIPEVMASLKSEGNKEYVELIFKTKERIKELMEQLLS